MTTATEADVIQRMLSSGRLSQTDELGHAHSLYGVCPDDGARAPIHRVSRAGATIIEVILRCPMCGHDIPVEPGALHMR